MSRTSELVCAHSAVPFATMLGLGIFFIPGWFPPVEPTLNADQIVEMFQQDRLRIRTGAMLATIGAMLYATLAAVIALQTKRIEGESRPLTYVQLATIPVTVIVIWLPCYFWLAMAYRIEAAPETLQLFNDFAWMMFIGGFQPALIQWLAIAWCILQDKREKPLYPKWVGYATIWVTLTTMIGVAMPFSQTGPFTWAGLLCFWLAALLFFGWIIMMWIMTVKAIKTYYASTEKV